MIKIEGLYKKYSQGYLYEDFKISFEEKKITSILGPSGCGKTTLLRIIAGIEPYELGKVIGLEYQSIGFIFQEDRLIPWLSVYENIRFVLKSHMGEDEIQNKIERLLKVLKLWEYRNYRPEELSGGMQRRVAIGRAFAYPSEVLLMDEPFKGLDSQLKKEVIEGFLELWGERPKTVIFITHQRDEAEKISHKILELSGNPVTYKWIKDKK